MSLVTRLIILIMLATIPIFAAHFYAEFELRQQRSGAERAEALRLARLVASDTERIMEGARSILVAISEVPFIRALDRPECTAYLRRLAANYPQIHNITLIDTGGVPVCASAPIAPTAHASDRLYFREAMALNRFVIGTYIIGRSVPEPQLPVALPFANDAGQRFVLAIGFDFHWLRKFFGGLALPPGATLVIVDRFGHIIVAPSDPALIGRPVPALLQPALSAPSGTFAVPDQDGQPHIASFQTLTDPAPGLTVIVDFSQARIASVSRTAFQQDLAVTLLSILAAIALTGVGARRLVSEPLRRLTLAAGQWSRGEFSVRVGLSDRRSEIGRLARAFDHMADTIEASQRALHSMNETLEQRVRERTAELLAANQALETEMGERQAAEAALRQAQKMQALGQLTAGIAHDFNNLLTAIGGAIELLVKALPKLDERTLRHIAIGRDAVERASNMTHRLLAFARQQPLEVQAVDINRLVAGMSDMLRRTLGGPVKLETVLAGGLWLTRTDPAQVENALLNMTINARDAMPEGGCLTIETANASLDEAYAAAHAEVEPGQYVMLAVTDTGTGMPPEVVARAFDPFFTTKPPGKGTGLGLSMIYGFAKQSGGHTKIYSEPGRGTTIKLYLPRLLSGTEVALDPAAASASITTTNNETVLVAEDDEAVREMTAAFLHELGYQVLLARDGSEALDLLRSHPETAVLFTDVVLGGPLDGRQLAEAARRFRPDLPVLFTTGYTPNAVIHGGVLDPGVCLLTKPFTAESLGTALRRVLAR